MNEITIDPETLGGLPVFTGTRVPVQALFDHLEAGDSLGQFLESFSDVICKQAIAVLAASKATCFAPLNACPDRRLPSGPT